MIYRIIFCLLFFLFLNVQVKAQYLEIGGSFGGTSYQGDINYLSSRLSFQGASALKGINVGFTFENYATIHLRYFSGGIEAYDSESKDPGRKLRNLSFKTPLKEWSITSDIEILGFLVPNKSFRLSPYVTVGVSIFKFNPQAKYKGVWYDLQPLSTEGQGIDPSASKPYKLTQLAIPVGIGMRYYVNPNFYVSIEVAPRLTFTDYLDDISNNYPDLELLKSQKGSTAVALSYRGELPENGQGISDISGTARGNPNENDWYIFNSISVCYRFELDKLFPNRRFSKSIICPRN